MIYLDNAATTRVSERAIACAVEYGRERFFNPSAGYAEALSVRKDIDGAAETIAELLGADRSEIVFTSCATESNNAAFECGIKNKKGNVVVSAGEHSSGYECALRLKSRGMDVRFVPLNASGSMDVDAFMDAVDKDTAFVSVIHCSNETGAINDISELCSAVKQKAPRAVFHSDGVQAFCKIPIDLHAAGVDLYSVSAHKVGGYKGVGAMYIRKGFNMQPFMAGGGQQNGRRSGTENVAGITGFAQAAKEYAEKAARFDAHALRDIFVRRFSELPYAVINGDENGSGYVLSVSFEHLRGEVLAHMAEEQGVLIGLGSACSSHIRTNRVLEAMGVDKRYAGGSIRISFCPDTTKEDAEYAASVIATCAEKLRRTIVNG